MSHYMCNNQFELGMTPVSLRGSLIILCVSWRNHCYVNGMWACVRVWNGDRGDRECVNWSQQRNRRKQWTKGMEWKREIIKQYAAGISMYCRFKRQNWISKYNTCYKYFDCWPQLFDDFKNKVVSLYCWYCYYHFSSWLLLLKNFTCLSRCMHECVYAYACSVRYCFYGQLLPLSGHKKLLIMNWDNGQ